MSREEWPDTERRGYSTGIESAVGLMEAHVRIDHLQRLLKRAFDVADTKQWRDKAGLNLAAHPLWDEVRNTLSPNT